MNFLRRHRKLRLTLISSAIFLALFSVYRVALEIQLYRTMNAIRAKGEPTTAAEAQTWLAQRTANDNWDTRYTYFIRSDIWENLRAAHQSYFPFPDSPATLTAMAEFLKASRVLESTERNDLGEDYIIYVPEGTDPKRDRGTHWEYTTTTLYSVSSVYETATYDTDRASTSLSRAIEEASSANKYASIKSIQHLASNSIGLIRTLEMILEHGSFTVPHLLQLENAFRQAETRGTVRNAFAVKRAQDLEAISNSQQYEGRRTPSHWLGILLYDELPVLGKSYHGLRVVSGSFVREKLRYLNATQRWIDAGDLQAREALVQTDEWAVRAFPPRLLYSVFAAEIQEWRDYPFAKIQLLENRANANLRCAQTACAIERFRLAEGRMPNEIVELVPEFLDTLPLDPFDNQTIRYNQAPGLYRVYCVGEDMKDDGGMPLNWDELPKGDYMLEVAVE